MERIAKIIILTGMILVVAGIIIWLLGDKFRWLGRLPGDIRIERENFYMPITTMIIISITVSAILWLIRQFIK
jgi:spore maturation protein SpmB